MLLHDYWRSSTSYRVRVALNLKTPIYNQTADARLIACSWLVSKKSRRPNAGNSSSIIGSWCRRAVAPGCSSRSVMRPPIWLSTRRTSGLVRPMFEGGRKGFRGGRSAMQQESWRRCAPNPPRH